MNHCNVLPPAPDTETGYRHLGSAGVRVLETGRRRFLEVEPAVLTMLARTAVAELQHFLRPSHLAQLRTILEDPDASENDRFVARQLLRNAMIAAGGTLPMCQDTGTAIVYGRRSEGVLTGGDDERALSEGIRLAYSELNLRCSQLAPVTFFDERNTGTNLPAQIELHHAAGSGEPTYEFLFLAKGGGSANKSFLYQETKRLLHPARLTEFLEDKLRRIGPAACPPYHLAIVVGGTSAEHTLKVAKLASARYLDTLPTCGSELGHAFRDLELEQHVLELTRAFGVGAQFGGKYFCHDVRVIRLARHAASCPVAIAVSCSADRQAKARITAEGVFLEALEHDPARFLPDDQPARAAPVARIDLRRTMSEIRARLSQLPVGTLVSLSGPLVVARDLAHARIAERLDAGTPLPAYLRDHAIYYAGPAKTPAGSVTGAFGPTTAGRMDPYVPRFQAAGGSLVTLAKGDRCAAVRDSCQQHGGFYLATIGGTGALLAHDCIVRNDPLEYPELGMDAVRRIEVSDLPALLAIDDKGNDFYAAPAHRG